MAELEALTRGTRVSGLAGDKVATVVDAKWFGQQAVEVTYKVEQTGQVGSRLVFRADEPSLEVVDQGAHWAFDAPGDRFRLAMEATRIRLAYLFDPLLALSTSQVEPLPHQISAVYETMLHRQPLRFLLADDPGAGKTIMAGLLLKELMLRGDVERCLIVVPASLEVQWQDELYEKFGLNFDILSRQQIELAKTNAFTEHNLVIARIDLLKQEEQTERLAAAEWDLVVVDEAHKMSASYDISGERHLTARYKLGQLLSGQTRHFLLMTATPHRGKDADFQLFMALLDGDRFEGRYRDDVHQVDVSDLMRRLLKEEMVDFDGKPLFPERRAYTVNYDLSDLEQQLYLQVTDYVANEMNRADRVAQEEGGEGKQKRAIVGFALTMLQRRLASSPNAIFRSLERRRRRLETALGEAKMAQQQASQPANQQAQLGMSGLTNGFSPAKLAKLDEDELLEDLEEQPEEEVATVVDAASAARSAVELEHEIGVLRTLERLAKQVYDSGRDSKWVELRRILQDREEMFDPPRKRRREMHVWTPEQARQFLIATTGDRLEALFRLALDTGMRQGELFGLRWRDVDADAGALFVQTALKVQEKGRALGKPKTEYSRRKIEYGPGTAETLRAHRKRQAEERLATGQEWTDNDLVFCNSIGGGLAPNNVTRRHFLPAIKCAGIPIIRFHDLRHTAATLMLLGGVPVKVVSERLGHSNVGITLSIYAHVLPSMQKDAADIMDRLLG